VSELFPQPPLSTNSEHTVKRRSGLFTAPVSRWFVLASCLSLVGCLKEPLESRRTPSGSSRADSASTGPVLLTGAFEQIAKKVSGTVSLEHHDGLYELVVRNVQLNDVGPVHVYFVGLDQVRSTRDLDEVDAKYDFGPLEEAEPGTFVPEQRIELPSAPAKELRSVVLLNPRFGVVLASSSLRTP
jgi:hypothetical protein